MDMIQATSELLERVTAQGIRPPLKWVIGKDMAEALRRDIALYSRSPRQRKHPGLLFKLHGWPVKVDGPPDEIRIIEDR